MTGLARVVQFNWPMYALSAVAIAALVVLASGGLRAGYLGTPRIALLVLAAVIGLQAVASLVVSFWIYDLSRLHNWGWLSDLLKPMSPRTIVSAHAGYDEITDGVTNAFPQADLRVIDFYSALDRREPSIEKAQRMFPGKAVPISTDLSGWPLESNSVDLVLLAFAAHEVRDASERERLFLEAARVVSPLGRVVVVEHLRDFANALAFGPGCFHFLPETDWLQSFQSAKLLVIRKTCITPFVAVFELTTKASN